MRLGAMISEAKEACGWMLHVDHKAMKPKRHRMKGISQRGWHLIHRQRTGSWITVHGGNAKRLTYVCARKMTSQEPSQLIQLKGIKRTPFLLLHLGGEKNQVMLKALKGNNVDPSN